MAGTFAGETNRQTRWQAGKGRQGKRNTYIHTYTERKTHRHTDIQTRRHTDTQTHRHTLLTSSVVAILVHSLPSFQSFFPNTGTSTSCSWATRPVESRSCCALCTTPRRTPSPPRAAAPRVSVLPLPSPPTRTRVRAADGRCALVAGARGCKLGGGGGAKKESSGRKRSEK